MRDVSADIEGFRYNFAIIKLRALFDSVCAEESVSKEHLGVFLKLLHPFCPHITEELWHKLGNKTLLSLEALPDLLLIDGGKGHLLTAAGELKALNLHIPLVSIAKEKENIYSSQPGKLKVVLAKDGAALNLIRRIRDEAHRFALAYHHLLRKKALIGR